jgi:hypothetical protein
MAIIYRTAGAWGAGNGANLTPAEVDGNFWDLHGRVDTLETTPPTPNNIADISATGSQMTITMDDASTFTVTMPTARITWTGDWATATAYSVNNLFSDPDTGNLYIVIKAHTSDTTFDAEYEVGGDPVYELVIDAEALGGGGGGMGTPTLLSSTSSGSVTLNPTLDQANCLFLTNDSVASGTTTLVVPANATIAYPIGTVLRIAEYSFKAAIQGAVGVTVTGSTFSTFQTRDTGSIIGVVKIATNTWLFFGDERLSMTNGNMSASPFNLLAWRRGTIYLWSSGSGKTVELPAASTTYDTAFRTGDTFEFIQQGAGAITINPAGGVTINTISGGTYESNGQGSHMTLRYLGSDTWQLYGDVT